MFSISFRAIAALLFLLLPLAAQETGDPADTLPRQRLVSDDELFSLLDATNPALARLQQSWKAGDSTAALAGLNTYLRQRRNPRYFFDSRLARKRAADFARHFPEAAEQTRARAALFMEQYGADLTWKQPGEDRQGNPHTPNTIRFLARQARATDIALGYYFSGEDRRYLTFLQQQIGDFVQDYEQGNTETGPNDVFERFYAGHRLRNWLFAWQLLRTADAESPVSEVYMLKVFLMHGARLIDDCIRFHWGNHQLHGLAGLYEMSLMYPELPVMRYWNSEAKRVIMEHISREIRPDGFQFERASHYFKLDIVNYFRIYQLSKVNGIELPPLFAQRFQKMFDAIIALARPDRELPVLQDAQVKEQPALQASGRKTGVDAAELADPGEAQFMSLGAALFNQPQYRFFGSEVFPHEFAWFFDREVLQRYAGLPKEQPALGSTALDSSRYYIMRSGWQPDALYLAIDAGLAQYKPDHTHGGILGITGYAYGGEILPTYRVRYNDPSYRTMKNSLVKTVALADRVLQGAGWISNHARTGFGIWKRLPQPQVESWFAGRNFDYFSGSHNAWDSLAVKYQRSIVFFKPFCWIVVDRFRSDGLHNYQQLWQGEFEIDAQYNRAWQTGGSNQLHLLQADPARMQVEKRRNFWTTSVEFEKQQVRNYTFHTLVLPRPAGETAAPDIRLFERDNYRQIVAFAGDYRHVLYFRKQGDIQLEEIATDAQMAAASYHNDELYSLLLHEGTTLKLHDVRLTGQSTVSAEAWRTDDGTWQVRQLAGNPQNIVLNP